MLLRFIVDNISSVKDATEFDMFPSSKSHSHDNHKVECGHATVLRMGAIYGANGAGKSNLINALRLLQEIVVSETLNNIVVYDLPFKMNAQSQEKPSGFAIEFYYNSNVYYYHIEFSGKIITLEELLLSKNNRDLELFSRSDLDISIKSKYIGNGISEQFKDALQRMVRPDMLLLSFLGKYYPNESPIVADAYQWFVSKLRIVLPDYAYGFVPHLLDTNVDFANLMNTTLPEFKTGIHQLRVKKKIIDDKDVNDENLLQFIKWAKDHPNEPKSFFIGEDEINIIYEDGNVILKSLVAVHKNLDGTECSILFPNESDGTRRLIEYMPLLFNILQKDFVYVVDEIERSLHPIMIKDIISKISESKTAKGQLIFTTHESCLLDQNIFRPDEIWFAQKDVEQATQLYPLSDFNIHKTANIENGYLNGRYGGIPFLSNLKDLNW
ncbi:MAG: ATP-binding protein [Bacteroidales bacterium]|nr:ATP-binding protein [Bacteroidales bacterium]